MLLSKKKSYAVPSSTEPGYDYLKTKTKSFLRGNLGISSDHGVVFGSTAGSFKIDSQKAGGRAASKAKVLWDSRIHKNARWAWWHACNSSLGRQNQGVSRESWLVGVTSDVSELWV